MAVKSGLTAFKSGCPTMKGKPPTATTDTGNFIWKGLGERERNREREREREREGE